MKRPVLHPGRTRKRRRKRKSGGEGRVSRSGWAGGEEEGVEAKRVGLRGGEDSTGVGQRETSTQRKREQKTT